MRSPANLAFILLSIIAIFLVFFMVRLQSLILSTQETPAIEATNRPLINQQPTLLIAPTATTAPLAVQQATTTIDGNGGAVETSALQATPTSASSYQVYGSTIIGAIHVGFINDRGFNQANSEGLRQMIQQVPNARLITVDNIPETAEVVPVIDEMVARGARIIFTQSFGYLPYVLEAAERYPDVIFMNAGGFELSENVGTYLANHVEAMYLTGMAAGAATQTGQLGLISAFPMPSSLASVNAFHLGARSINANVKTRLVNNGSWVDPVKEKLATEALASVGVDVVAMIVDSPITIVETAKERGIYAIGFHSASLQELAPDNWLTGVEHTWGNFFTQVVEQVRAGQWQSGHARGGIESDMFGLAPFGPVVSAEMQARILATRNDLISGRLNIFAGPIVDNLGIVRVPAGRVGDPLLLDQTDWLIEGVSEFDATSVAIQPPPARSVLPPTNNESADSANGGERPSDSIVDEIIEREEALQPTATALPLPTAGLLLAVTDQRPECTFFTTAITQIIQDEFAQTVDIVDFSSIEAMYEAIANRQNQRTVDLTLCYSDPLDRPFLREYFGFVKHIGNTYWEGPAYRLQILANTGFAVETEREQSCLYQFLRNIYIEDTDITDQTAVEWVAENPNLISEWSDCNQLPE